ncbi:hypothetical protein [Arthrobacter globiformis]|uniref:hypothetical protein n=1 Tax=Arthrobacter globiformis TaxID=1665 RepID=UPI000B41586F|nr:hypothetical protein [Arthrobacter globiformis]
MRSEPTILFTVGHGASSEEDFRNLNGAKPVHLMPAGRMTPHQPTGGVRAAGDQLIYDVVTG